jgi:hypothetical protein
MFANITSSCFRKSKRSRFNKHLYTSSFEIGNMATSELMQKLAARQKAINNEEVANEVVSTTTTPAIAVQPPITPLGRICKYHESIKSSDRHLPSSSDQCSRTETRLVAVVDRLGVPAIIVGRATDFADKQGESKHIK